MDMEMDITNALATSNLLSALAWDVIIEQIAF